MCLASSRLTVRSSLVALALRKMEKSCMPHRGDLSWMALTRCSTQRGRPGSLRVCKWRQQVEEEEEEMEEE